MGICCRRVGVVKVVRNAQVRSGLLDREFRVLRSSPTESRLTASSNSPNGVACGLGLLFAGPWRLNSGFTCFSVPVELHLSFSQNILLTFSSSVKLRVRFWIIRSEQNEVLAMLSVLT
jgi:hypothetical protein